jgi:hypothetical protein
LISGVAVLLLAGGALAADGTQAIEKAMGPYYAALVASARGNTDATSRHLLLFASRWESAAREARSAPPAGLAGDPTWPAAIDRATALLGRARDLVRTGDVPGAHAELEGIRLALHDVRARHNVMTFDDYLTEYHDAVERVNGHVAGRNEIRLTSKDIADVDEDLQSALTAWRDIQARAGALASNADWKLAAREAENSLHLLQKAVAARDAAAVTPASEHVKATYFALLLAIAKARD